MVFKAQNLFKGLLICLYVTQKRLIANDKNFHKSVAREENYLYLPTSVYIQKPSSLNDSL